jgi:Family of unknown function (DUF5681)
MHRRRRPKAQCTAGFGNPTVERTFALQRPSGLRVKTTLKFHGMRRDFGAPNFVPSNQGDAAAIASLHKESIMTQKPTSNHNDEPTRSDPSIASHRSDAEYKVGPGRPPRGYRFKPGKSGNPKGAKPKPPSIAPDLKLALERALNKTVKLKQGEKERIVTMAVAGIEQLVAQFAKGDRHARRDRGQTWR